MVLEYPPLRLVSILKAFFVYKYKFLYVHIVCILVHVCVYIVSILKASFLYRYKFLYVCVGRNLYMSSNTIQSVFQTVCCLKRHQIDDFMCF
jgi:hypothetical protein